MHIYNYKVFATNSFLDGDDFSGYIAVQNALEDGVDVVNCSWGVAPIGTEKSREARAVDEAWDNGLVVIKSAGNDGSAKATVTTPAEADGVIVVGATGPDGAAVESKSSRGPALGKTRPHLVAPGGDGLGILTCALVSGGFGYAGGGSSYSATHATGVVALMLEQNPDLIPDQVRTALMDSARGGYPGTRKTLKARACCRFRRSSVGYASA